MEEHNEDTLKLKKSTLWKAGTVVFGLLFLVTIFHDVTEEQTILLMMILFWATKMLP